MVDGSQVLHFVVEEQRESDRRSIDHLHQSQPRAAPLRAGQVNSTIGAAAHNFVELNGVLVVDVSVFGFDEDVVALHDVFGGVHRVKRRV